MNKLERLFLVTTDSDGNTLRKDDALWQTRKELSVHYAKFDKSLGQARIESLVFISVEQPDDLEQVQSLVSDGNYKEASSLLSNSKRLPKWVACQILTGELSCVDCGCS